jgi:hypothetical protein
METKDAKEVSEAQDDPKEDMSTGGGPKSNLLLMGLMGMLLALGLSVAGVTIGSIALVKANDNEDMITDLRDVVPLDPGFGNEPPDEDEDPTPVVRGDSPDTDENEGPDETEDPTPVDETPVVDLLGGSPTLQGIHDRDVLKCAVVASPGFTGVRDGELYGIDIDIVSSCWHGLSI